MVPLSVSWTPAGLRMGPPRLLEGRDPSSDARPALPRWPPAGSFLRHPFWRLTPGDVQPRPPRSQTPSLVCPDLVLVHSSLFLIFSPGQRNCLKCHPSCRKCVGEPERCTVCEEGFRYRPSAGPLLAPCLPLTRQALAASSRELNMQKPKPFGVKPKGLSVWFPLRAGELGAGETRVPTWRPEVAAVGAWPPPRAPGTASGPPSPAVDTRLSPPVCLPPSG